jgi:hypothetical protein
LEGLDKETFDRVSAALDQSQGRLGYDAQGRLKLAFFDAKSYDQHCGHDATKPW